MREISTQEQMSEMSEVCGAILPTHDLTSGHDKFSQSGLVISRVCAEWRSQHDSVLPLRRAHWRSCLQLRAERTNCRRRSLSDHTPSPLPHHTSARMHCAPAWRLCQMALCRRRRWLVSDRLARDTGSTQTFSVRRLPDLSPELGSESSTSSNPGLCWPAAMESDCRSSGTEP